MPWVKRRQRHKRLEEWFDYDDSRPSGPSLVPETGVPEWSRNALTIGVIVLAIWIMLAATTEISHVYQFHAENCLKHQKR